MKITPDINKHKLKEVIQGRSHDLLRPQTQQIYFHKLVFFPVLVNMLILQSIALLC